ILFQLRQFKRERRLAQITKDRGEQRIEKLFVERDDSRARRIAARVRSLNGLSGQRLRPSRAHQKKHDDRAEHKTDDAGDKSKQIFHLKFPLRALNETAGEKK